MRSRKLTESSILKAVLLRLRYHHRIAWAERINTGAYAVEGRYVRYGFPGCSDVIGQLRDGRMLAIEVKRPLGRITSAQDAFLQRVRANGGVAGIVRSIDDLEALLSK